MAWRCPCSLLALFALATLLHLQVLSVPAAALAGSLIPKLLRKPSGWEALRTPRSTYTDEEFQKLYGFMPSMEFKNRPTIPPKLSEPPKVFDARKQWSRCNRIRRAFDKEVCSCWAFAALDSFSDRLCAKFGINVFIPDSMLQTCCNSRCGGNDCTEGYPLCALKYFIKFAVVIDQCNETASGSPDCVLPGCQSLNPTQCGDECQDWNRYRKFPLQTYSLQPNPADIMAEIYTNGPVESHMTVYTDFEFYESGVYNYTDGDKIGNLPVKIIGWDTSEEGEDYWVVTSPLGGNWSDDGGVFNILRGSDMCGIESNIVTGMLFQADAPISSSNKFILISIFVWAVYVLSFV